ncbi:hypothetical protein IV48_GL000999 [Fructilactobacillus fructivorans]|nr:hypothetical protein FC73_GL000936 [Fructilactobacillus fructivorans]KRN41043.1 hypothetical protein IV51_GL000788 [Fructilactobacillus fructivorans]KRN42971.1 hypothetical protein IV48_GL000999 [Fructilactobacillus fructivorans]
MMPTSLSKIKLFLDNHIGQEIHVTAQAGRKRTNEYDGVLSETFPAVFLITLDSDEKLGQVSYSYTDILTKNIEINFV